MTTNVASTEALQALHMATVEFIASHPAQAVGRFRQACRASVAGATLRPVEPCHLPVSDLLQPALQLTTAETKPLLALYHEHRRRLHFEQSYSRADGVVSEQMLAGYGFAEIVGERGPLVSRAVRLGIGIWADNIDYPIHRHRAEEIYIVLAGSAEFSVDDTGADASSASTPSPVYSPRGVGDVVWVPSNTAHGFRTTKQLVVVLYAWQDGDLREKSTFESPTD